MSAFSFSLSGGAKECVQGPSTNLGGDTQTGGIAFAACQEARTDPRDRSTAFCFSEEIIRDVPSEVHVIFILNPPTTFHSSEDITHTSK